MILKDYLLEQGFEQKLPWQFHNDSYMITIVEDSDSYGFEIWSITVKRYDSVSFRGRIRSVDEFKLIFALVKEDYNLSEDEIKKLKIAG
jgi:hypothetical protein